LTRGRIMRARGRGSWFGIMASGSGRALATHEALPYARNARTHSDEQVAQIAASIREWGWTIPVLVDEQGTLIAGHGRVLAAQQLGITDVPTRQDRRLEPFLGGERRPGGPGADKAPAKRVTHSPAPCSFTGTAKFATAPSRTRATALPASISRSPQ
jgi:hypothetical protein